MSEAKTPSAVIIAEANETAIVTDAKGRVIEIRRLRGRAMAKFIRACGRSADIQTYFGEAVIRASAVSIDNTPVPAAVNEDQVDRLWDMVDQDAAAAIATWFTEQAEKNA